MAKVLVTGGSGFIGSNLALTLQELAHEVTVLDWQTESQKENLIGFRGKVIQKDLSKESLNEAFDIVFHQAAITDPRHPDDQEVYDKNVKGFENLIDYCLQRKARLIYASTAGLYGNGPVPMKEDQPKEVLTPYGASKLRMDEIAEKYFSKMPVVGLRYFNVYGPRETLKGRPASMIYHLFRQWQKGGPLRLFTRGEQTRDFVYVKDIVEANLRAVEAPSGVYNAGTGVATSLNQLAETLFKVLGKKVPIEYFDMPYDPKTYQHQTQADMQRAKLYLKFTPTWSLESGIKDYVAFLQA